jgi:dTDP-4-dehydrorhamnose 3,5-epimerase
VKASKTFISDLIILEPHVYSDNRGEFYEFYNKKKYVDLGIDDNFVQDNHSLSCKGTIRGLHFQIEPKAQSKLIRVVDGEIYDVVVDLRLNSPTYLKWFGIILSSINNKILYIPKGFAHGFYVLSEKAAINYKCNNFYSVEHERTLHWQDPELNIQWPLYKNIPVIISEKDNAAGFLNT